MQLSPFRLFSSPCVARLAKAAAKRCLLDFGGRVRTALRRDAEVCHAPCATVFDVRGPAGVLLSQQPCDAKRRYLWLSSVLRCARLAVADVILAHGNPLERRACRGSCVDFIWAQPKGCLQPW